MHQLAVVGGVRNANGVPGVFGPADGRGQFCMPVFVQIQTKVLLLHFFVCALMHLQQFTQKAVQCFIYWPLRNDCPFLVTDLSKKSKDQVKYK